LNYILGVDGGAAKTVAVITDIKGNFIMESESGPSNYKSIGVKSAKKNINEVIFSSLNKLQKGIKYNNQIFFISSCFGLSGYDSEEDLEVYKKIVFNKKIKHLLNPKNTMIYNDAMIGLSAGSENKNRIIIICGTGSNCYGINEYGIEARAGGWDYILSDEDSGYSIVVKALKAAVKYYDGRGKYTLLLKTIFEDLGINTIGELMNYIYNPFSKEKIASLAKTVGRTADLGDEVSIKILREEALEAFNFSKAVVKKLRIEKLEFDCVLAGSIFKCEKYFTSVLVNKLKEYYPEIYILPLNIKPVEGAVRLAIKSVTE